MGVIAQLLSPYAAAVNAEPTTPASLGMGTSFAPTNLMQLAQGGGQGPSGGGNYDPDASRWEQVAAKMARNKYGWGADEFADIDSIISRESGWNPNAVNPSSGAYGIPQILPAAHPDSLGLNPREQIRWLLNYIQGRYGSPSQALAFKDKEGWY